MFKIRHGRSVLIQLTRSLTHVDSVGVQSTGKNKSVDYLGIFENHIGISQRSHLWAYTGLVDTKRDLNITQEYIKDTLTSSLGFFSLGG
jgi:hypothetical protein